MSINSLKNVKKNNYLVVTVPAMGSLPYISALPQMSGFGLVVLFTEMNALQK